MIKKGDLVVQNKVLLGLLPCSEEDKQFSFNSRFDRVKQILKDPSFLKFFNFLMLSPPPPNITVDDEMASECCASWTASFYVPPPRSRSHSSLAWVDSLGMFSTLLLQHVADIIMLARFTQAIMCSTVFWCGCEDWSWQLQQKCP